MNENEDKEGRGHGWNVEVNDMNDMGSLVVREREKEKNIK